MLTSPDSEPSGGGAPPPGSRIFRSQRIGTNDFVVVADDAPLPDGAVMVTCKRFLAEKELLLSRPAPLGVRLETSESPELLGTDVSKLAIVELHIPYFKDGRAFSWARLLRTRSHFTGEIRLTGHFLLDQIAFFLRVGVDSFTIPANWSQTDVEQALGLISNVYQPSADHRPTILDLRRRAAVTATAAE